MQKTAQIVGLVAMMIVLFDAMITYFTRQAFGIFLPVNAIIPFIVLGIFVKWGAKAIMPPLHVSLTLLLAAIGFSMGMLLLEEVTFHRLGEVIGAMSVFLVAYFGMRWSSNENAYARLFLFVGGAYAVVCIIALLKIAPAYFPVINAVWAMDGKLELRPEVMTDQNFQVFYLLPIFLVLALPFRLFRFTLAIVGTLGALYVLAKLQTRSGTLLSITLIVSCILAPLWTPTLGRMKTLFLPVLGLVAIVLSLGWISHAAELLIDRFTQTDMSTGYHRLLSTTYLFEHLFNPSWWVPQGYGEFKSLTGGTIPHSNVTAMFLEGGILALYMWIAVFVLPLVFLMRMFFRKQLDPLATLILVAGIGSLVIQLSLNVPFFKQPWLWAGAVVGTLYRSRQRISQMKQEKSNKILAGSELLAEGATR